MIMHVDAYPDNREYDTNFSEPEKTEKIVDTNDLIEKIRWINNNSGDIKLVINLLVENEELLLGKKVIYKETFPTINKEGVFDNFLKGPSSLGFRWHDDKEDFHLPNYQIVPELEISANEECITFQISIARSFAGIIRIYLS